MTEKIKELENKLNEYVEKFDKNEELYTKLRSKRYYLKKRIDSYSDRIYHLKQGQLEIDGGVIK